MTMNPEIELKHVAVWICTACLDNDDGECHTPGCLFWLFAGRPAFVEGMTMRLAIINSRWTEVTE